MTVVEQEIAPLPRRVQVPVEVEERARVLEAAALEIEVRGWTQLALCRDGGPVCALGAIGFASGWSGDGNDLSLFATLTDSLIGFNLVRFNNASGRTADDVTFLLRWRACELRDGWDNGAPEATA